MGVLRGDGVHACMKDCPSYHQELITCSGQLSAGGGSGGNTAHLVGVAGGRGGEGKEIDARAGGDLGGRGGEPLRRRHDERSRGERPRGVQPPHGESLREELVHRLI